jgi:hypothetical protein
MIKFLVGVLTVWMPVSLKDTASYWAFIEKNKKMNRTMVLGSTQPLIEISTRNVPGGKWRPARKADNLTAICEPIV